eukprot:TRINITY_DN105436_c0_g1_i1.p1 TRINITY_DN105436_c0_g1~~TRINITY_DN105436_c0_g1_i1.p1  ORF type:complete len:344 (-),score=36.98 TRINITY_DN105436_c0_g1_i1:46-999(-)
MHRKVTQNENTAIKLMHAYLQHEVQLIQSDVETFKRDFSEWGTALSESEYHRQEAEKKLRDTIEKQREYILHSLTAVSHKSPVQEDSYRIQRNGLLKSMEKGIEEQKRAYQTDIQRWADERCSLKAQNDQRVDESIKALQQQWEALECQVASTAAEVESLQQLKQELTEDLAKNLEYANYTKKYRNAVNQCTQELNGHLEGLKKSGEAQEYLQKLTAVFVNEKTHHQAVAQKCEDGNRLLSLKVKAEEREVAQLAAALQQINASLEPTKANSHTFQQLHQASLKIQQRYPKNTALHMQVSGHNSLPFTRHQPAASSE